jgi:tRNA 2-thiouridine synthesizing protein A
MSIPVAITHEIDARGSHCPGPLMELVRAIKTANVNDVVAVISSDVGSKKDIPLWVAKAGHELIAIEDLPDSAARFIVRKLARRA